ncbi:hypothetical protein BDR26DRAFT_918502 [Obelidium mucronatum]|nr:hypothetical protein BDR26DRAFT_918502 [Obelidium mucronatum]
MAAADDFEAANAMLFLAESRQSNSNFNAAFSANTNVSQRPQPCAGCRAWRRKCDTAKPACGRCVQRGITCVYVRGVLRGAGVLHAAAAAATRAVSCKPCHARKTKCDKARPRCGCCRLRNLVCEYFTAGLENTENASSDALAVELSNADPSTLNPSSSLSSSSSPAEDTAASTTTPSPDQLTTNILNQVNRVVKEIPMQVREQLSVMITDLMGASGTNNSPPPPPPLPPSNKIKMESADDGIPTVITTTTTPLYTSDTPTDTQHPTPSTGAIAAYLSSKLPTLHPTHPTRRIELKMCHYVHPPTKTSHYVCLSCIREYKTPGGLKYHMNESHYSSFGNGVKGLKGFPEGYYWGDLGSGTTDGGGSSGSSSGSGRGTGGAVGEDGGGDKKASTDRYACTAPGCGKRYTALSGLKYHLKHHSH